LPLRINEPSLRFSADLPSISQLKLLLTYQEVKKLFQQKWQPQTQIEKKASANTGKQETKGKSGKKRQKIGNRVWFSGRVGFACVGPWVQSPALQKIK
jgi:hypothetical protein